MFGLIVSFILGAVAMFIFKSKLVAVITPLKAKLIAKLDALRLKLIALLSKKPVA